MLDTAIKTPLQNYLTRLVTPIELTASLDDSDLAREMHVLLQEIAALSPLITLKTDGQDTRRPSFRVGRPNETGRIVFAGIPLGHEFTSLVLALLQTGGHPAKVEAELIEQIHTLTGPLHFEVFISLSCHNCPEVVQALNLMALSNPAITNTMIDGALFQEEVEARQIMGVPAIYLNGDAFGNGRMGLEEILAKMDAEASRKRARTKLQDTQPFEVLVIGGGPAGAAAAIYAARKGIRTGVISERFGGQILDTLAIENFVSVSHTDGPKLGIALEQHVKDYDVDILNLQRATKLIPATASSLTQVHLENGAMLESRTVILAPGARWREMNVPGEAQYRNRGVAFCPHCDGPLFKGKRVAVVGGGNSGVEAAIDLAGMVSQLTLLEFSDTLRADAVLQKKLASLANVTVIKQAQTLEVLGDGQKVNGLVYRDRASGTEHRIELDGIFVQIGLLPNTEWLKDTLMLSPRGEIEIDARGQTSAPGVFAAGDATTVPFKQIVIAMGEGAKASLAAFDYLIRH